MPQVNRVCSLQCAVQHVCVCCVSDLLAACAAEWQHSTQRVVHWACMTCKKRVVNVMELPADGRIAILNKHVLCTICCCQHQFLLPVNMSAARLEHVCFTHTRVKAVPLAVPAATTGFKDHCAGLPYVTYGTSGARPANFALAELPHRRHTCSLQCMWCGTCTLL